MVALKELCGVLPSSRSLGVKASLPVGEKGGERRGSLQAINRPATACDLVGLEIDSLMTRPASCVICFWCDLPVMTSDPAVCSKELSAGTFNYRGDWFWPRSPPRLVFIFKLQTDCKTTLPALSPRTKRCSRTKAAGALIIILWATVTLFLLTAPPLAPRLPPSPPLPPPPPLLSFL